MRREKKAPSVTQRERITQNPCRCNDSEELRRRNEEMDQLLIANRQLAMALNTAKSDLAAAKKKCARADILFMQHHVQQARESVQDVHPAYQDASVQCDFAGDASNVARGGMSSRGIDHRAQASSGKSAPPPPLCRHGRLFLNHHAPKKRLSTASTTFELVVTKSALREHKTVVYKEPNSKTKLRQSLPGCANSMHSVQQTPPRKRTLDGKENQPPPWQTPPATTHPTKTRNDQLSTELADLLNACDEEESSSQPCLATIYNSTKAIKTLRPSISGLSSEPTPKKHRITRRGTTIPEYKEVSLNRKMRQGDRYTFHTYFKY
ncbi:hypothetical protein H310_08009 [Aphanomyces invadans]|uniref:Uncharacterized protein n=1 Tax=Aphanomyces invadans TaxID=157072 RepID=A0A024TZ25_9STRA|nr:hypothetical protein H310_08009 [Aphanomyces invadans]ETV99268.1 hypothetical protein H310_08009 [Aphanomyces invadans]|eukprot:XP_008871824.1 hypothetical protein H310_08009 [Aphanomyces invadans]